jgi:predicted NUDIX family NTP pyrophosphohydrolase
MITSAGLAIILRDKILMGHPNGNSWVKSYSIPKGLVDDGENILNAAIRETEEEIGVTIKSSQITKGPYRFDYPKSKFGKKQLYFFIVEIDDPSMIGMKGEIVNKSVFKPNKEGIIEIDWAGFITFSEARKRASRPMQKMLDIVESIYKKQENFKLKNYDDFNAIQ